MMRRAVKVLGLLALAPILMGGGGINPAPPGAKIAKSPKFRATIVVDPHAAIGDEFGAVQANATTTAKQATIQLREEKKGELLCRASRSIWVVIRASRPGDSCTPRRMATSWPTGSPQPP
jgi:hypothetical protein